MGLFSVDMNDISARTHLLESKNNDPNKSSIQLNDNQLKFLKRFFRFQSYLIKKVKKDNQLAGDYLIIQPKKGGLHENIYIAMTKQVLYVLRNGKKIFKFRLIKDRLRLEMAVFPSNAFVGLKEASYKGFFSLCLGLFQDMLSTPSQFLITYNSKLTAKMVNDRVIYSQVEKYL